MRLIRLGRHESEPINEWLNDHPTILGSGALVLGVILIATGVSALKSGRATTKWGIEVEGFRAKGMGVVWLVTGVVFSLFGFHRIISGIL